MEARGKAEHSAGAGSQTKTCHAGSCVVDAVYCPDQW